MILERISKKTKNKTLEYIDTNSESIMDLYTLTRQDLFYRSHFIYFENEEEERLYFDIFTDTNLRKIDGSKYEIIDYKKTDVLTEDGRIINLILKNIISFSEKINKNIKIYHCSDFLKLTIRFNDYQVTMKYNWKLELIEEKVTAKYEIALPMEEYLELRRELQKVITNFRYYNYENK